MYRDSKPYRTHASTLFSALVATAALLLGTSTVASAAPSTTPAAATAPAAHAGSVTVLDQTCPYPYVCLYNSGGVITGRFRDVTSGWQWLTSSRGAAYARNTRHDDIVFYHFTDGRTYCAAPEETTIFFAVVDAIRISWASSC